ncbi:MAG: LysR family transcriptional regulator, partial [Corynebacterium casei]|nr:LysR family transcriptional regulator [Corynebacterium casei]
MLDLHRLSLLRELAIRGTITEVAAALNFAPSTVSAQLSRLEKEARTTLLVSSGRKVMLTTAALGLVEHTNDMLAIMEEATAQLAEADSTVSAHREPSRKT